jgi:hypothetical protein
MVGKYTWVVPDGYLPVTEGITPGSTGYLSHESLCVLNANKNAAFLQLIFYFEEREPVKIKDVKIAPERSRHIRINELKLPDGSNLPTGSPYSLLINSNVPVVIQMSRLDTTQTNMAFLSTMAYPLD